MLDKTDLSERLLKDSSKLRRNITRKEKSTTSLIEITKPEKIKYIASVEDKMKQVVYNFKAARGKFDIDDVITFEPKGFVQKTRALLQNTQELTLVLLSMVICVKFPSFMGIGFIVLNHDMLYFSMLGCWQRLSLGRYMIAFNMLILVWVVAWKAYHFDRWQILYQDQTQFTQQVQYLQALGYHLKIDGANMSFQIDKKQSLMFEICMSVAYLFTIVRITNTLNGIKKSRKNYMDVIMMKNFEYEAAICDSDDEKDKKAAGIGKIDKQKIAHRDKMKNAQKEYQQKMQKMRKSKQVNYLDCHFFQRMNKGIYLLLIILQLIHSMSFNGLFDLPQLLLILTLFGFFAFRKLYHIEYGFLNFFVAYYFQFALTVKTIYLIAVQVPFVKIFMTTHSDHPYMVAVGIIFGQIDTRLPKRQEFTYYSSMIMCVILAQMWKQAKWIDIRDRARMHPEQFSSGKSMFWTYLDKRTSLSSIHDGIESLKSSSQKQKKKQGKKGKKESNRSSKMNKGYLSQVKNGMNQYLPTIVLWCIRVLVTFQAYMYHTNFSMAHLFYVLMSFVFKQQVVLFFSVVVMIPLYSIEFIIVYGSRIPFIQDTALFQRYSVYYSFEMQYPVLEQFLFFIILIGFYLTASCFKLGNHQDQNEILIKFIYSKVSSKETSLFWKLLFFVLKYIQTIALIAIFINVSGDLNRLRNLGFMLFFVVYTASEYLYRKTSKILVVFIAFFICGQYYFSLVYHNFIEDDTLMAKLKWLNLYEKTTMPNWEKGDSIYFRHTPYAYDWVVLLIMCALNFINFIFVNEQFSKTMQDICYKNVRDAYAEQIFAIIRFKNSISRYMIFVAMITMFYFIGKAQTNIINWGFFVLNILNFAFIAKGDNKPSTNRHSMNIAIVIKIYSAFMLIFETVFISFVGEMEKIDQPKSLDQRLKNWSPAIYNNLDLIGLRLWIKPGEESSINEDERAQLLSAKFLSYISYLMISIYLIGYFDARLKNDKGLDKYSEEEFKDIFEFESQSKGVQRRKNNMDENSKKTETKNELGAAQKEEEIEINENRGDYTSRNIDEDEAFNRLLHSKKSKTKEYVKKTYSHLDLMDMYESIRYTTPFVVYQWIDYWPLFDIMASYGHIFNNMIIVLIAINYNVSFFMCFNVGCVCLFYSLATYKVNQRAMMCYKESGLQSQTDLKIAKMVTKSYKTSTFCVFLQIRHFLWKLQFSMLVLVSIIGFCTTLLSKYRDRLTYIDPIYHKQSIDVIDNVTFYVFMAGLYKDNRPGNEIYFYGPLFVMTMGFILERNAINWLTNRHGLTYNRLQKCIELELRRKSIEENWEIQPPRYSIDHYKSFYYGDDFQYLRQRFIETDDESENLRRDYKKDQIRDYIPYKVAQRIKEFITFSVKLAGRSPDLKIDSKTSTILKHFDEQVYASEAIKNKIRNIMLAKQMSVDLKKRFSLVSKSEIDDKLKLNLYQLNKEKIDLKDSDEKSSSSVSDDSQDFHGEKEKKEFYFQFDFESVPILRDHKIRFYESILKQGVERKYKISFYKGVQMVFETLTLLILMISVVLKSNVFSIFYLIFMLKYFFSRQKVRLLVRMAIYIAVTFFIQYAMFVANLTTHTSPAPFPSQFDGYPANKNAENLDVKYRFPFFFKFEVLRDLKMAYLVGIGVEKIQVSNLLLDFLNLYLVSMYILHYRNPLLVKSVEKIFWSFPAAFDNSSKWNRLTEKVKHQVKWLYQPTTICEVRYNKSCEHLRKSQKEIHIAEKQYQFAVEYNQNAQNDINQVLINYVDMKYDDIWSFEKCRSVKMELKQQCIYFRLVKQGSILVYLTFHIFTILYILMMAALRQSFLAIGYVFIVLPYINDASEVLIQRNIHADSKLHDLEEEIKALESSLESLDDQIKNKREESKVKERAQVKLDLWDKKEEHVQLKQKFASKTFEQKQDEKMKIKNSKKEWYILKMIKTNLMCYALFDFFLQIAFQMPLVQQGEIMGYIGFRKVWQVENYNLFNYSNFINHTGETAGNYSGYKLMGSNFYLQCINCLMICMISLQTEIFESPGYKKFVTQRDGSMDLLMQLSDLKAQSLAYCFNNQKIRKIISIQRRKESIMSTVDKIKMKLIQWRKFQRATLDVDGGSSMLDPLMKGQIKENHLQAQSTQYNEQDLDQGLKIRQKKSVAFDEGDLQENQKRNNQKRRAKLVSKDDIEIFGNNLAHEFVTAKLEKLNWMSKLYLYLNKHFVTKIMLKNEKDKLTELLQLHSTGQVEVPSELETIMFEDAKMLIKKQYDHRQGAVDLYNLIAHCRGKTDINMLDITNLHNKIKLSQMKRTWEFTRAPSMAHKLLETLFYMIISNTQNLIYLSMIYSMYANAGLLSIVYPISMFGYALIEETRPRKEYWVFMRNYTSVLVFIKFVANLSIMDPLLQDETFLMVQQYLKIGLYDKKGLYEILRYMSPEIFILTFLMLNDIQLRLIGLYYITEKDLESVQEGIQRNIESGDFEKVKLKKIQAANMCLRDYFVTLEDQIKQAKERIEAQQRKEAIQKGIDPLMMQEGDNEKLIKTLHFDHTCPNEQAKIFKQISRQVWKSSREFDVDTTSNSKVSPFDQMVRDNELQKSLENDNLTFVEGKSLSTINPQFNDEIQKDLDQQRRDDAESNGDFMEDLNEKLEFWANLKKPRADFFDDNPYFENVFPSLKIQKPGYDLYGSSTVFLAILAIFTFLFYPSISVDQASLIDSVKESNNIFKGEMAVTLIIVIAIIIIERYVNRSDTKANNNRGQDNSIKFFQEADIFKSKSSDDKSMTIQLKTMKTSDLDVQGNSSQQFLKTMYGSDNREINQLDNSKSRITRQQKCKFIMHWIILIGSHIFVFWYIPISGNYLLYGTPQCNEELKNKFGCKNFHSNPHLRFFYIIIASYLALSALQMKYGFTIQKKASSVMQYNTIPGMIGAQVFMAIPFAIEVRCLLDFTFSKTALDVFQFWQLFLYHIELYICKMGNISYTYKVLGSQTTKLDKIIFGWLFQVVFLGMLIGPIYFFSDYGGFIAPNPVKSGMVQIAIIIQKSVSQKDMLDQSENGARALYDNSDSINSLHLSEQWDEDSAFQKAELKKERPYFIYENRYPFFRQYDEEYYNQTQFNQWTETRYFKPDMLQDCISNEYSDNKWILSRENKDQLSIDLKKAVDPDEFQNYKFKLGIYYSFDRELPAEAITATGAQFFELDLNYLYDCQSGQQLVEMANLNCTVPSEKGMIKSKSVRFTQVLGSNIVLGASKNVSQVIREGANAQNELHDLMLTYSCNNQWTAHASQHPVNIPAQERELLRVDNKTCELLQQDQFEYQKEIDRQNKTLLAQLNTNQQTLYDDIVWYRVKFTLFSMMVSASLFASFNITTFYTTIVIVAGSSIRPLLIFGSWTAFIYETTHPDAIIRLIEACYMKRHEEDLIGEEEIYRMLQEIMRSPQLLKSMCGSSLKGACDPLLDKLTPEDKRKLEHLNKLESKGYEVTKLKDRITKNRKADDDYNF